MNSYGPRVDHETGETHARVSQAHDYQLVTTLWRRRVGTGSIECRLYKSTSGPARRIVQLHAQWTERDIDTSCVVGVDSPEEEAVEAARLERVILGASILPLAANDTK